MFEELAVAVERVSIPVDGAALAEVIALSDRLAAKVSAAVAASTPPSGGTSTPPPP